jgi:hypothetical protein
LDRASASEAEGCAFNSHQAHQRFRELTKRGFQGEKTVFSLKARFFFAEGK